MFIIIVTSNNHDFTGNSVAVLVYVAKSEGTSHRN